MRLTRYIRAEWILPDLEADDAGEVLQQVALHLAERGVVPSAEPVREALLAREAAHTTAMGHRMALPNATIEGLDDPVLSVALAGEPIQFGPVETDPVEIFFVLLSPPGREREHIKLLARICRLARHPGFIDALRESRSGEEALEVIERIDEQHV